MSLYDELIIKINKEVYSKDYLCGQVIEAKQFIDTHFSESISLNDIAIKACISKFHFLRLFKTIYGNTPHQYLTCLRLTKAKQYLLEGSSVSEACFSCGFHSISSFQGLFKRYTGFTPASFHKQKGDQQALTYLPLGFLLQKSNNQDS